MKTIFKKLRWAMQRKDLEKDLMNFCRLEYSASEAPYAFARVMAKRKAAYLEEGVE